MISTLSGNLISSYGAAIAPAQRRALADLHIVAHGDSLTQDRGSYGYLPQLKAKILNELGLVARTERRGINGISFDYHWSGDPFPNTLIEHGPKIDALLQSSKPHWLIIWAGSNGIALGGHTPEQEHADFIQYIDDRIAANWNPDHIVVPTLLSRSSIVEPTRQEFISLVVGSAATKGYRVARVDLDPDIGGAMAYADTDWFYEDPHLNNAGQGKAAGIIFDTMFPS